MAGIRLLIPWLVAVGVITTSAPTALAQRPEWDPNDMYKDAASEFFRLSDPKPRQPSLFRQIGGDFQRAFTTTENLPVLVVGLSTSLLAVPLDDDIPRSRFNGELYEGTRLEYAFDPGNTLGGALVQIGGALTAFAVGKLASKPEVEAVGRDLIRAQVITQTLTQAIKVTVRRTRPDASGRNSYPSGHTSATFATATVLDRRYGWKVGLPAYGIAGYVAAARLSENKHYLSDVVFGAALGIFGGRTVTFGRGAARFTLGPAVYPEGGGVQLTLLPNP